MFKSINEPPKQGDVMPFCLNGPQATALCSQIIELADRLAPGGNQTPLAYKTYIQQSIVLHHRQHGQQEPPRLTKERVGWMANIFYEGLLFFDINSSPRDTFTRGEAHFDALMPAKQECVRGEIKRLIDIGTRLSNPPSIFLLMQSWQPEECGLSCRRSEGAAAQPRLLRGVWKYRRFLHCAGFFIGRSELLPGSRQLDEAVKDRPLTEPCLRFIYWSQ